MLYLIAVSSHSGILSYPPTNRASYWKPRGVIVRTVKETRAVSFRLIAIILFIFALACDQPSEQIAIR